MTPDREHDDTGAPPAGRAGDDRSAWRRGPDPDAPPWARGDRGAGPDDEPSDDESRDATREDDRAGGGRDGGGTPDDAAARGSGDGPTDRPAPDDQEPGQQLARVARGMPPPRPPRRTGVFVDPDDLREHVGGLLRAILGGYEVDAFGNFTFTHEGARVFVTVGASPIGPQVGVFSVTNLEVALSPRLAAFLLTTNHTIGFGAFSYDPSSEAVWLRHTLLGTTLDGPELQAAVAAIATTAARFDDAIKEQFGGRTFQEVPSEVQERMEPPEPSQEPPPNVSGYL